MVAFALFGLLAYVLEQPFGIRKGLVAGMALGAWANLHGTFYFGFGLVGGAVVAWSLAHERRLAMMATLALVIGAGLSLLSPYGLRVWSYPLQTASNPYLIYNDDWASLRPLSPNGVAMGLLLLIAIGVGLRPATDPRVIASLGLVLPAIHIARFSPFAAPLLAFVSLRRLVELRPGLRLPLGSPMLAPTGSAMAHRVAGMLLLCGTLLLIPTLPPSLEGHGLAGRGRLPTRAVDLLLACGEPAPVWNDYNWGAT